MEKKTENTQRQLSPAANAFALVSASLVAGTPADILSFPFCRVKTVMMTQVDSSGKLPSTYYQTTSNILRTQGLPGFYRGFAPFLMSSVPGSALFFFGVDTTKSVLGDSTYSVMASGFVGQIVGSIAWIPGEILKELKQMTVTSKEFQNKTVTELTRDIYKQEGIKGFYRGFVPQLFSFGPFNSIGLTLSDILHKKLPKENTSVVYSMLINAFSFGLSAWVTTPIDVLKTRIQVAAADRKNFPDSSIWGCAKNLYQRQGALGFCSGAVSRAAWLGSRQAVAVTFFQQAHDASKKLLLENGLTESSSSGPKLGS